jgi:hypothetical protein
MSYRVRRKGKGVKPVIMTAEEICAAIREGRLDLDDIYHEHYGRPDPLHLFGTKMRLGESPVFRQAYADLVAAQDEVAAERRRAMDAEVEASMLHGLSGIQVSWRAGLISLLLALSACPKLMGRLHLGWAAFVVIAFISAIYYLRPRRHLNSAVVLSVPVFVVLGFWIAGSTFGPWAGGASLIFLVISGSYLAGEFGHETASVFFNRMVIMFKYAYALTCAAWIAFSDTNPFQGLSAYFEPYIGRHDQVVALAWLCMIPLAAFVSLFALYILFHVLSLVLLWLKDGPKSGKDSGA